MNTQTCALSVGVRVLNGFLLFIVWLVLADPARAEQEAESKAAPAGLSGGDWASIRAAHEAWRHGFVEKEDGTWTARNPGQGWGMEFDGRGFEVKPEGGGWEWGLELRGYGVGPSSSSNKEGEKEGKREGESESTTPVPGVKGEEGGRGARTTDGEAASQRLAPRVAGNRLTFAHDLVLEEWFINDGRGLEQGWTVKERPVAGAGDGGVLRLELAVRGGLRPVVSAGSVAFADAGGAAVLTYGGLKAWDAEGRALAARFAASGGGIAVEVEERGAVYPVTIDPIAQQAYLKASNTGEDDHFGISVAISGDTVVVGAAGEDSAATGVNGDGGNDGAPDSGAAYVFVRTGAQWSQQAYLKASNTGAGDEFGFSVAISGDIVVVGARYEDSASTGINEDGGNDGAPDSGAAYVFVRTGAQWSQQAYLKAGNAGSEDLFGFSVGVSGNTVVVGAYQEDGSSLVVNGPYNDNFSNSGAAYVFVRTGAQWSQQAYLKASNAEVDDRFGYSVGISGDTIVAGAWAEDSLAMGVNGFQGNGTPESGAAYVFVRTGAQWSQQAYLKAHNTGVLDHFGMSVAVSGDTVVVGATGESSNSTGVNGDGGNNDAVFAGAAYVFARVGTQWSQQAYLKASNTDSDDMFGRSVAVSGDIIVVGAADEDSGATGINGNGSDDSVFNSGAAYVFVRTGTQWNQQAYLKASNPDFFDVFGFAVGVSDDTVVVGAFLEESGATGINGNPDDNSTDAAGAVFIFTDIGPVHPALAKSGLSAPGGQDIAFAKLGAVAINELRGTLSELTLAGAGAARGRNRAIFSTLGAGGEMALALQSGDEMAGLGAGYLTGQRVKTLLAPVANRAASGGLFRATVSGKGLNAGNNQALLRDNGTFMSLLRRTGQPVAELGGALPSAFVEVAQAFDSDTVAISYKLGKGAGGVGAGSDSGVLVLDHAGVVLGATAPSQEGQPEFGGSGLLGQSTGRVAAAQNGRIHFTAAMLPGAGGKAVQAVFGIGREGVGFARHALQGDAAPGAEPALFRAFPALSQTADAVLFRATLSGSPAASNEGLWRGGDLWLRKGVVFDAANHPGLFVKRIVKFWPVGDDQLVVLALLGGTGVKGTNNQALLLRQSNGEFLMLLRKGQPAPGAGNSAVTVAAIQAVEVDPVNGHYAVLGSLKGAAKTANQVLWAGQTTLGNNTASQRQLRLPAQRLRKGDSYRSAFTYKDLIRGLSLKPAVDPTGAGGRGLGQVIGSGGRVVVDITGDRKTQERLLLDP